MSVVIIGGNDRMVCRYRNICREYNCEAKIYTQPKGNLECLMGNPDLIVLFTNPVAHEMIKIAKKKAQAGAIPLVQSHCASCSSLRNVLAAAKATNATVKTGGVNAECNIRQREKRGKRA
jgi:hypothetical protein